MVTLDEAMRLNVGDFVYEVVRAEDNLPRMWRITERLTDNYNSVLILRVRQVLNGQDYDGTGLIRAEYHLNRICLTQEAALDVIVASEVQDEKRMHDRRLQRYLEYGQSQVRFVI